MADKGLVGRVTQASALLDPDDVMRERASLQNTPAPDILVPSLSFEGKLKHY